MDLRDFTLQANVNPSLIIDPPGRYTIRFGVGVRGGGG